MVEEWSRLLRQHTDEEYKQYVLEGLQHGFRIGFRFGSYSSLSAKKKMRSALDNPEVVDQYLAKEVGLKRVFGPSGTLHASISESAALGSTPSLTNRESSGLSCVGRRATTWFSNGMGDLLSGLLRVLEVRRDDHSH